MKRVVWIISEGSPGHVSQSVGLVAALGEMVPLETRQFECRPRIRGFTRHLIRLIWMGKGGRPLPRWMLEGPLGLEPVGAAEPAPDLIVSSGGRSVFAARTLAVMFGVPLVFLGERKPYPPGWFHTVFTPSALETGENDVRMDLIPTSITPGKVSQAAADWTGRPGGRLWTMLIGGASRSHNFQDADWETLVDGMVAQARRAGIRWLVTTSRRTGLELEGKLRGLLPPDVVADAVWWCHQPEKKLPAYLGAAEVVWVTEDSVSMVTEAVAAGKPVVAVRPVHTPFPRNCYIPGYLANLESLGILRRLRISEIADARELVSGPPGRAVRTASSLAETTRQRLGWD
jgi:mitochondrial fission protein ELM1